jgi:hypothetical protein
LNLHNKKKNDKESRTSETCGTTLSEPIFALQACHNEKRGKKGSMLKLTKENDNLCK